MQDSSKIQTLSIFTQWMKIWNILQIFSDHPAFPSPLSVHDIRDTLGASGLSGFSFSHTGILQPSIASRSGHFLAQQLYYTGLLHQFQALATHTPGSFAFSSVHNCSFPKHLMHFVNMYYGM